MTDLIEAVHTANGALCEFQMRWDIDGDYIRCRKCKQPQLSTYANEAFMHAEKCRNDPVRETHPWITYLTLLAPIAAHLNVTAWNTRPALLMDAGDGAAALALLSRMRFACGDNGLRMQDELEEYLRELARDAARYRWLRAEHAVNSPLAHVCGKQNGDRECGEWVNTASPESLDAAIDAAMHAPGGAGGWS